MISIESFQVYDRWGNIRYEEVNRRMLDFQWDGRMANQELLSGQFLIRVSIINNNSERQLVTHDIQIMR